ncbi:MAG: DUF5719 family protein [Actinomycetota bacterium]
MIPRYEIVIAIVLAVVVGLGAALDLKGTPVPAVATTPSPLFEARADFCPPFLADTSGDRSLAVQTFDQTSSAKVGIEPRSPSRSTLGPEHLLYKKELGRQAVNVVGYDAPIGATQLVSFTAPVKGVAAMPCTDQASAHWFLPAGSSALGYDERLLLYNPFPDEAVVRVSFLTSSGLRAKANLADKPVPARGATTIKLNKFILTQATLGVQVDTIRGRVTAWNVMFAKPKGHPTGVQGAVGAPDSALRWYFPDGGVGSGLDETLTVVNPNRREARVTVSLIGDREIVQPPKLVNIAVPPDGAHLVSLPHALKAKQSHLGGLGAIVQSSNGVPIAVARTMTYDTRKIIGRSSELGAVRPSEHLFVPPATASPTSESIILMNASPDDATISITLTRDGGSPLQPSKLTALTLRSGSRIQVAIGKYTDGSVFGALVTSTAPVVAERLSYSRAARDTASVMGIPAPVIGAAPSPSPSP